MMRSSLLVLTLPQMKPIHGELSLTQNGGYALQGIRNPAAQ